MIKIMFDDACGLTKAVLTGNKTRTARFEKMPDRYRHYLNMKEQNAIPYLINTYNDKTGEFTICQAHPFREGMEEFASFKPRYKRGDTYAVAQPYCRLPKELQQQFGLDNSLPGWTNKMFVKPAFMPWCIRIINVEIFPLYVYAGSEHLCLEEGIVKAPDVFPDNMRYSHISGYENAKYFHQSGDAFASLINEISGPQTWQNHYNDWIVSYKFEVEPNIITL